MANRTVTRTHIASIRNQRQARDGLDSPGFAASKLWNVARWTAERLWSETGRIPGHIELSSYLTSHERYGDLNAQSSSELSKYSLKRSNHGTAIGRTGIRKRTRQHTASTGTSTHAPRSHSKRTVLITTARTGASGCRKADRLDRKRTTRRTHFLHAVSKDVVEQCTERGVGTIVVSDLAGIRGGEDWGDSGNLDLHGWAFDRFRSLLEYKAEARGIEVAQVDERGTSKTCSMCGTADSSQRLRRGLYVSEACGLVANADCNAAENIRQKELPNLATDGGRDRNNGRLAQSAVHLFDKSTGRVSPQEQAHRKP